MPTNRSNPDAEKALKLAEEAETFALLAPQEERAKIYASLALVYQLRANAEEQKPVMDNLAQALKENTGALYERGPR